MQNLPPLVTVHPAGAPLRGTITVGPDKSITHRALFFGALNHGATIIRNPSQGDDPIATLGVLRALGHGVSQAPGEWRIGGAHQPGEMGALSLDCANSGTTARLAAGLLTGEHGTFTLLGDASLVRRPMERVAAPLRMLGARIETSDGHMPVTVHGGGGIRGEHQHPIAVSSAQVHAALVLAGIRSERGAMIRREKPMRDHTLRMARRFGVTLQEFQEDGAPVDYIHPANWIESDLAIDVPGDFSSAAFMLAAALIVPGSSVRIEKVGLNPTRIALLHALAAMNARLRWEATEGDYEPVGWIEAEYSPQMQGIALGGPDGEAIAVAEMIDELPLLALLASQAQGRTVVHDAWELRVKESDRIAATAALLGALGLKMMELEDGFVVSGPQPIAGGAEADHHGDHRLCMIAAVAALAAGAPVRIPHPEVAGVSYPEFWNDFGAIGAECTMGPQEGRTA